MKYELQQSPLDPTSSGPTPPLNVGSFVAFSLLYFIVIIAFFFLVQPEEKEAETSFRLSKLKSNLGAFPSNCMNYPKTL